jgi:hypothetical protein
MNDTPMRRLPQQQIWTTMESMLDDLENEFNRVNAMRDERKNPAARTEFVFGLSKLRALAEELLRWELL